MSFKEFDTTEIEKNRNKYRKEIEERWGDTEAYKESEQKMNSYDKKQLKFIDEQGRDLIKEFSDLRGMAADSEKVQQMVKDWQSFITRHFYKCTNEILSGLGQMYILDERFKNNIDSYGEGTAQLMADAIVVYCRK